MLSILRRTSIWIMALLLTACSTMQAGRNFDLSSLEAKIERGSTTQSQVRTWLGDPSSMGISVDSGGERFDDWTYFFATGKLPGMSNLKVKLLQLRFDKQGVVRGYNWSSSGP
ncbi:MAG: hypothetical protein FD173_2152 [Gallionellaceae bacterium]|nr:MAG: hypothetical protein FD173_2152 [Gallionellaceae bacterium]